MDLSVTFKNVHLYLLSCLYPSSSVYNVGLQWSEWGGGGVMKGSRCLEHRFFCSMASIVKKYWARASITTPYPSTWSALIALHDRVHAYMYNIRIYIYSIDSTPFLYSTPKNSAYRRHRTGPHTDAICLAGLLEPVFHIFLRSSNFDAPL